MQLNIGLVKYKLQSRHGDFPLLLMRTQVIKIHDDNNIWTQAVVLSYNIVCIYGDDIIKVLWHNSKAVFKEQLLYNI